MTAFIRCFSLKRCAREHGGVRNCDVIVGHNNFSLDHEQPISRGGSWSIANLVVCCEGCNRLKGNMTGDEYRYFRSCLEQLNVAAVRSIVARLKAGGKVLRG